MDITDLQKLPPKILAPILQTLSYREREIIKLLAGLGDGYSYTLEEVAHVFKVSEERIAEFGTKALEKIEHRLTSPTHESTDLPEIRTDGLLITLALPEFVDESFVTEKLCELYSGLDLMHRAAGGSGLVVNDEQSSTGRIPCVNGVPTR